MYTMGGRIQKTFLTLPWFISIWTIAVCFSHPCCKVELNKQNSQNGSYTIDCSHCGLPEVPIIPINITHITSTLRLRHNRLSRLSSFIFEQFPHLTVLDLFGNPIQDLEDDCFSGLHSLQHLDLRRMEYNLQKQPSPQVFAPLTNLLTLKLDNVFPGDIHHISSSIFSSLTKLTFLQMAVPERFAFGEEFKPLMNLETLVIYGWNCNLGYINLNTFAVFSSSRIKVLEIRDCKVAHVEPNGLEHFTNLNTLNLACNKEGTIANFFEAVKQVPSESLTSLILDGSNRADLFQSFEPSLVRGKVFQQLTHLSLRSTKILKIEPEVFLELPQLECLNFGFNMILMSPDKDFYNRTAHIINAGKLRSVDISHFGEVFGGHNNFRHLYCRDVDKYSDDFFLKVPQYISLPDLKDVSPKQIDCTRYDDKEKFLADNIPRALTTVFAHSLASRNTKFNGLQVNEDNNVVYMDFSLSPIKWFAKPIIGLKKLQGLDLSSCRIESIIPDAFSYLPSLIYLNLTRNHLKDTNLQELLGNVVTLRWLDLSFNDLESIPNNTFGKMENLTSLILKGNHINQVNLNFTTNNMLEFLDLSLCALPYLDKFFIQQIEELQQSNNRTITLDLSGNTFECECSALYFIEWLNSTDIEVTDRNNLECRYKDVNTTIMSVDTTELKIKCSGWPSNETLVTIAIGIMTLASSAVYLAFSYRWTLRWYYYKARRNIVLFCRKRFGQNVGQSQLQRRYKAFISYDWAGDPDWTENVLVSQLEDDWNMPVCLTHRDFDGGPPLLEIIYQAVTNSQYTILVITPSYEDSYFYEMMMAIERGVDHIIIIYKDEVQNMSDTLRGLLTLAKCLEYVEEPQGLNRFWTELHDILDSNL